MRIVVEVRVESADRPPSGAPVHVEARDTTYADAPSETVAAADGRVRGDEGPTLDTVELELDSVPAVSTIWVHVDVDGDERVSVDDFVTMASYPVPAADGGRLSVTVRRV
jgi:hypothetical protein